MVTNRAQRVFLSVLVLWPQNFYYSFIPNTFEQKNLLDFYLYIQIFCKKLLVVLGLWEREDLGCNLPETKFLIVLITLSESFSPCCVQIFRMNKLEGSGGTVMCIDVWAMAVFLTGLNYKSKFDHHGSLGWGGCSLYTEATPTENSLNICYFLFPKFATSYPQIKDLAC